MKEFFRKHIFFVVSLFVVNSCFVALLVYERSFGGDFWLHLWLIKLQEQSFTEFAVPALLSSFDPAGTLSTAPLFTGGFAYSVAGLVDALGASTYAAAITFALIAFNAAFISSYALLDTFRLTNFVKTALAYMPLAFAFPIGDGFGRGGLSSMIAGLFGIAAVCLLTKIMVSKAIKPRVLVLCVVAIVFATSTHLPSAIIFGVFSIPMVIIAGLFWKERVTKKGVLLAGATTISGFLMSSIYLVPTLTWALQASNQATQVEPFQLGASQYYADPFYQWNLLRLVPPGHVQFWTDQTSDGSATTLITTLPTLLYLVAIAGLFVAIQQKKFRLYLGALVPLTLTTVLLIVPEMWTVFPYPLRSLQYSFRVSYAIIPWLMICVALVVESTQGRKLRASISAWVVGSIVVCTAQSFVQLATTNNLSILPTGDQLNRFVRDVPPSEMLTASSPEFFWYASSEQKAVDNLNANMDVTGCTYFDSGEKWPSFPAVRSVSIPKDFRCAYFSMNLPVSWLNIDNATVLGRDPNNFNLIVKQVNKKSPTVISLNLVNPMSVSVFFSAIGIVLLGLITFPRKRNAPKRAKDSIGSST